MWLIIILFLSLFSSVSLLCYHCFSSNNVNSFSQVTILIVTILSFLSPLLMPMPYAWHWQMQLLPHVYIGIELYYDGLTWIMLCLVSFISLVINSYAARYLLSDKNQIRFMGQLSLLTFSVMLLMMSGSLFTAFVAWQFIGISLYLLLNHYHYNVNANKSAKKKFIINRLGDMCFLIAVLIAAHQFGTTKFTVLFQQGHMLNSSILLLVFIAVMTKSAQFPFHIWLIDTMEAPTPVSAMMHAGVINAGGFLLARLSPLYDSAPYLMLFITLIGMTTAFLGNYFMQNQADVKRQLAYSTMSQMGYMVMQCGLGCFVSAVFHLVAHGFFKATLFLSSASQLKYTNFSENKRDTSFKPALIRWCKAICLTSILIVIGYVMANHFTKQGAGQEINLILWLFIAISLFQLINQVYIRVEKLIVQVISLTLLAGVYLIYLLSLQCFASIMQPSIPDSTSTLFTGFAVMLIAIGITLCMVVYLISAMQKRSLFSYRLYSLTFYKLNVERCYRRYLLNPLRYFGDYLTELVLSISVFIKKQTVLTVYISSIAAGVLLFFAYYSGILFKYNLLSIINIFALLGILVIANRAKTLKLLLIFLALVVVLMTCIALTLTPVEVKIIGIFQLINSGLLMLGLLLVSRQCRIRLPLDTIIKNRLPCCYFYMSLGLMMLIGIPGTASFVSEFYLLDALLQINWIFAVLISFAMILLTLVVLHGLQVYFFNPAAIRRYAVPITVKLHVILIAIIVFNVFNGIYPHFLLNMISKAMGV